MNVYPVFVLILLIFLNIAFFMTQFGDANPDILYMKWKKWLSVELTLMLQLLLVALLWKSKVGNIAFLIGLSLSIFQLISIIPAFTKNPKCKILQRYLGFHITILAISLSGLGFHIKIYLNRE